MNLWTSRLAPEVAAILIELSHELQHQVLSPGKLNLHQLVKAFLACRNIDIHENASLYCFFVAQLDDYFRRLKGTLVAQALLSCPVVIQGSRWEHLDTSRAVATLVPALDYTATGAIYQTQLGIINLAPNVDTSCHDRMLRAAGHHAFGLTNRSSWLEDLCPALSRTSFQFEPAHIREMVHTALEHPADCVELGREFGRRFRQAYPTGTFISQLCLLAELSRLQHAPDRPLLQPHIIW